MAAPRAIGYRPAWHISLIGPRARATGYRADDHGREYPLQSRKMLRHQFHLAREAGARIILIRTPMNGEPTPEGEAQAKYLGFPDYWSYVGEACMMAWETSGPGGRRLLPALDVGPMQMQMYASLGSQVDHVLYRMDACDDSLLAAPAFHGVPDKAAAIHARALSALRSAKVRVAVALMVGIGESDQARLAAVDMIAAFHKQGGRLVEVQVAPFIPFPNTPMADQPMAEGVDVLALVTRLRESLPNDVAVCLQPEGRGDLLRDIRAGAADRLGYLTLNRALANGRLEVDWFESEVGEVDRYRHGGNQPIREQGLQWNELGGTGPWPSTK